MQATPVRGKKRRQSTENLPSSPKQRAAKGSRAQSTRSVTRPDGNEAQNSFLARAQEPRIQVGPAASLATFGSPVNVWEFEYPWLEYRRPMWGVMTCVAVFALLWGAHSHRAELHGYWLQAPPELHRAWAQMEAIWGQCQPYVAEAWSLVVSALK